MSEAKSNIFVESYRSSWVDDFNSIRELIWPKIHDVADAIEHVGSTSVPGLAAKPIIDVDVIASNPENIPVIIERLESVGYQHRGDLGIKDREAFRAPPSSVRQNFYVCLSGSLALRNHLILRDHLRTDADARRAYSELKQKIAKEFADDIDSYVEAKTELILKILAMHGLQESELNSIRNANLKPLALEPAKLVDVDEILSLIVELSRWLRSKGILQWSDGYSREKIEAEIRSQHIHVMRLNGDIAAAVTLSDCKDDYWKDFPGEAVYLHRLAIHRSQAGKNLGARILSWSETEVAKRGISLLRLDCNSKNSFLQEYYISKGFGFCGIRPLEEYNMDVALFEKDVGRIT